MLDQSEPWSTSSKNYQLSIFVDLDDNVIRQRLSMRHIKSGYRISQLKEKIENAPKDKVFNIDLTYITSRGKWYHSSWKGDETKSGGIASNIGIHFFDMLQWIFGPVQNVSVDLKTSDTNSGTLYLSRAKVKWLLSINSKNLPKNIKEKNLSTFRCLKIEGEEIEFSDGFTDLHTMSYKRILEGNGYGLKDAKTSIEIVSQVRNVEL